MIDETWLSELRFETFKGGRVVGLAGIGAEKVNFIVEMPDGKKVVMVTYRHVLGYHIREIPLLLTEKPLYDVGRLNEKLSRLVGNPQLDDMTGEYDRLYSSLLLFMHKHGVEGILALAIGMNLTEEIPFILHTPGMKRRLESWANLSDKDSSVTDYFMRVNGPNFPIVEARPQLVKWAKKTLKEIERVSLPNPDIKPQRLPHNPLYVWGAAVMDYFFTEAELPAAVEFIRRKFGPLPEHKDGYSFTCQADALAHLLVNFLQESEVQRFVKFCAKTGILFQVRDRAGNVVADGFRELG